MIYKHEQSEERDTGDIEKSAPGFFVMFKRDEYQGANGEVAECQDDRSDVDAFIHEPDRVRVLPGVGCESDEMQEEENTEHESKPIPWSIPPDCACKVHASDHDQDSSEVHVCGAQEQRKRRVRHMA